VIEYEKEVCRVLLLIILLNTFFDDDMRSESREGEQKEMETIFSFLVQTCIVIESSSFLTRKRQSTVSILVSIYS